MSQFSDLLSFYAKRAGVSAPQIAAYCNMDRVTVYRFMKGKSLPKEKDTIFQFTEILRLTTREKGVLSEAYDLTRFGPHTYWERRYIRLFMRSFTGSYPLIPILQYDLESQRQTCHETEVISGREYTIGTIQQQINLACKGKSRTIELIMRTSISPVMDMLLSAGKQDKELQITHLIPISRASVPESDAIARHAEQYLPEQCNLLLEHERGLHFYRDKAESIDGTDGIVFVEDDFCERSSNTSHGVTSELLQSFYKVICLCAEGFEYTPLFYYSDSQELNQFPLYSNLLVTQNSAVLFTDDLHDSILFTGAHNITSFRRKFCNLAEGKPLLSYFYKDADSLIRNMSKLFTKRNRKQEDIEYYYTSLPCVIPILTNEIIQSHLRTEALQVNGDERDNRLLDNITQYITAIQHKFAYPGNNQITFITESGIRAFMKTGRVAEVPPELYTPLTLEERKEILLKIANHPYFHVNIVKRELSAPEGLLSIEVLNSKILFIEFYMERRGTCFIYINEPGIYLAFRNYFSNYPKEELFSEEESKKMLRSIAAEY